MCSFFSVKGFFTIGTIFTFIDMSGDGPAARGAPHDYAGRQTHPQGELKNLLDGTGKTFAALSWLST